MSRLNRRYAPGLTWSSGAGSFWWSGVETEPARPSRTTRSPDPARSHRPRPWQRPLSSRLVANGVTAGVMIIHNGRPWPGAAVKGPHRHLTPNHSRHKDLVRQYVVRSSPLRDRPCRTRSLTADREIIRPPSANATEQYARSRARSWSASPRATSGLGGAKRHPPRKSRRRREELLLHRAELMSVRQESRCPGHREALSLARIALARRSASLHSAVVRQDTANASATHRPFATFLERKGHARTSSSLPGHRHRRRRGRHRGSVGRGVRLPGQHQLGQHPAPPRLNRSGELEAGGLVSRFARAPGLQGAGAEFRAVSQIPRSSGLYGDTREMT